MNFVFVLVFFFPKSIGLAQDTEEARQTGSGQADRQELPQHPDRGEVLGDAAAVQQLRSNGACWEPSQVSSVDVGVCLSFSLSLSLYGSIQVSFLFFFFCLFSSLPFSSLSLLLHSCIVPVLLTFSYMMQ